MSLNFQIDKFENKAFVQAAAPAEIDAFGNLVFLFQATTAITFNASRVSAEGITYVPTSSETFNQTRASAHGITRVPTFSEIFNASRELGEAITRAATSSETFNSPREQGEGVTRSTAFSFTFSAPRESGEAVTYAPTVTGGGAVPVQPAAQRSGGLRRRKAEERRLPMVFHAGLLYACGETQRHLVIEDDTEKREFEVALSGFEVRAIAKKVADDEFELIAAAVIFAEAA